MKLQYVAFVLLIANSPSICAHGEWVVGAKSGKLYFSDSAHNDYISPGDLWPNDRYVQRNVNNVAFLSFYFAKQWQQESAYLPFYELGLSYSYVNPVSVQGFIDQYSSLTFRNYHYYYDTQSQVVLLNLKTNIMQWHQLLPYIKMGLGVAYNRSSHFQESPFNSIVPRIQPDFTGNESVYLASSFEFGADYFFNKRTWVELGYEFANYGRSSISYAGGGTLSTPLRVSGINIGIGYYLDS